jgi:hypothetical protein
VIPAGGSLYISPSVPDFLARTTGPRGGQRLLVQGNYSGQLKDMGEEPLRLVAADGLFVAQLSAAVAGDYNEDLVVNTPDYDLWRANFGSTALVNPDGNANGVVDAADYVLWRKRLATAQSSAAAVSELNEIAESKLPANELIADDAGMQQIAAEDFALITTPYHSLERRTARNVTAVPRRSGFAVQHDIALLAVLHDGGRADGSGDYTSFATAASEEHDPVHSIDKALEALADQILA